MDALIAKLCPQTASKYGATMGRRSWGRDLRGAVGPFWIRKIKLVDGYDPGGAYWGERPGGQALYGYLSQDGSVSGFVDALTRKDAVIRLRHIHPNAKLA